MGSKNYWQKILVSGAIVLMSFMAIAPMLVKGYPINHSTQFNLSWGFQYQRQFWSGQFYPRWLEFSNFGFGNATFVFYPPMWVVATLPLSIFMNVPNSLVGSMVLAALVLATGLYKYARLYFPSGLALAIAFLGVSSPYFLIDIYQRGAMAEVWAIVFIPWVFLSTQNLINDPKPRHSIFLGIAWGLLGLSHLPTLLVTFLVWLPMPLILKPKGFLTYIKCYLSAIAGFIGISFFLLPVILDQQLVQIDQLINFSPEYLPQKRLMLDGLLTLTPTLPTHWFESGSGLIPYFGIIAVTGMLGAIAWMVSRIEGIETNKQIESPAIHPNLNRAAFFWIFATTITLLMTTDILAGVYQIFPTLQKIQFSWRWYGIAVTTVPMVSGYIFWQVWILNKKLVKNQIRNWISTSVLLLFVLAILTSYAYTNKTIWEKTGFDPPLINKFATLAAQKQFPQEPKAEGEKIAILFWHWIFADGLGIVDVPEYRAKGVFLAMPPDRTYPLAVWEDASQTGIQIQKWSFGNREIAIADSEELPNQQQNLLLRMFYYPSWQVEIDHKIMPLESTAQGQVKIAVPRVPRGDHLITVVYVGTIAEQVGKYISLIAILSTLGWYVWQSKSPKSS